MEHVVGGLAAQDVVAGDHDLLEAGHPAHARGGRDVVAERRRLPGPERAHRETEGRDPAPVHPVEPGQEGRRAHVLPGHEPGERRAQVVEVAREGLLFLVRDRAPVAPAERVDGEDDVSAPGQFVADEPSAEVPVGPALRRGQTALVEPGPDQLLLPDVELGAVVVQEEDGRERSGAVRGEQGAPHPAVPGEREGDQLPCVALAFGPPLTELGGVGGLVPGDEQMLLDLRPGHPPPGAEVPDRRGAPGEREAELVLEEGVEVGEGAFQRGGLGGGRGDGQGLRPGRRRSRPREERRRPSAHDERAAPHGSMGPRRAGGAHRLATACRFTGGHTASTPPDTSAACGPRLRRPSAGAGSAAP